MRGTGTGGLRTEEGGGGRQGIRRQLGNRVEASEESLAISYYQQKLLENPTMPKYNHHLAILLTKQQQQQQQKQPNKQEQAAEYYRKALEASPNNVMIRNDYALFLHHNRQPQEPQPDKNSLAACNELKKGLLIVEKQPILHSNLCALYARTGRYQEAMQHAKRSSELRPEYPMNIRNLAKIQNLTGDSRTALAMNLRAIDLEKQGHHGGYINTDVYRAAAIQSIAKGETEQALQLVREARGIERKLYQSSTTERTNEIIAKIMQRKGDQIQQIEKEAKEQEERDRAVLRRKKMTGK